MSADKIFLAESCGFCYGVKRAVDLALTTKNNNPGRPVYTLGPIIHNPQMVAHLAEREIHVAENVCDLQPGSMVIIRSHGVGPKTYETAEKLGLDIVDATCPHVKKAQQSAFELLQEGYQVIIIGEAHHPEVKSILKWTDGQAIIIEKVEDAQKLNRQEKLGIVAQTTFSAKNFQEIIDILHDKCDVLKINRTICTSTDKRQAEALDLASKADIMIVVGGKNSANTSRLAQTCSEAGCTTYFIETSQELSPDWFSPSYSVGITAGASTPDWIIREVHGEIIKIMENISEQKTKEDESLKSLIKDKKIIMPEKKADEMISYLQDNNIMRLENGSIISGQVIKVTRDEVYVNIGYKSDGVIPLNELAFPVPENAASAVNTGDIIDVYVLDSDTSDGSVKLSKLKADITKAWDDLEKALAEKTPLEGIILSAVKGGLKAAVLGVEGFIPASLFDFKYMEDLSPYIGQKLRMIPIELDRNKTKLVLSRKELLLKEQKLREEEIFAKLKEGEMIKGKVSRIAPFGAFVDLDGIDGLIHISDLSWQRVSSVEDIVKAGDEVKAVVLKIDPKAKKISLSLKETVRDPWFAKADNLSVNSIVVGKIVKIVPFGVFIKLPNGLEGLVHVSEISEARISKPQEAFSIGQETAVKILSIDPENKRISLSMAKAQADKERSEYQNYISKEAENSSRNSVSNITLGEKFPHLFSKLKNN